MLQCLLTILYTYLIVWFSTVSNYSGGFMNKIINTAMCALGIGMVSNLKGSLCRATLLITSRGLHSQSLLMGTTDVYNLKTNLIRDQERRLDDFRRNMKANNDIQNDMIKELVNRIERLENKQRESHKRLEVLQSAISNKK